MMEWLHSSARKKEKRKEICESDHLKAFCTDGRKIVRGILRTW
jgi:hypothetical protein